MAGVPEVVHDGQGGLGDIIVSPTFVHPDGLPELGRAGGDGGSGAAVARATLTTGRPLTGHLHVIWRQQPKTSGTGHYGHRLAFSPDGRHLFVTSGERQKMTPAQDLGNTLWARSSGSTPTAARPPATRSPIATMSRPKSGPMVTATRWASPSTPPATCGAARWGRVVAMS